MAESGGGVSALAHSSNNVPTAFASANYNVATPPMSPDTQQTHSSMNVAAVTSTPSPPQSLNRESMHIPPPPSLPPVQAPSPSPSPSTSSQPSSERPQQQQQRQQSVMYFPPPPGQNDGQKNISPRGSSSPSSPTTVPSSSSSSSSSMIPPYNPAYATTQLPHSHLQNQQQQQQNGGSGNTAMPSLGPTATPSFGLSMNGPTIPLVNNYSRRPESLRRMSKYVNKESAKKAYKSSVGFLAKTGEYLDKYAQPAMPLLAATNPDIAAAYQLQQALKAGSQQQQQLVGGIPGSAAATAGAGGLAAVGGLATAGLAGYALMQGLGGGGDGTDALSMLASLTGQQSTTGDPTASLLSGLQSNQTQPDLSALLQGAAGGQQQDLISAMLQQQQQQSSDATASLLAGLGGNGVQGVGQTDPSQQIMDYIQQQSAASTQTLLSAMQNNTSSAQGGPARLCVPDAQRAEPATATTAASPSRSPGSDTAATDSNKPSTIIRHAGNSNNHWPRLWSAFRIHIAAATATTAGFHVYVPTTTAAAAATSSDTAANTADESSGFGSATANFDVITGASGL
ncbi:hypothetical protein PG987_016327 [Apiospora arundinis]